ncbi:MAG TPA: hypothetical protein EYP56_09265 [Planctomycetaceae bacterium]|nr:hypothetical protein [Planctomycetaceae bacterium]HIQ23159.1 hypothetical protein [Planctomycetota bacterium]
MEPNEPSCPEPKPVQFRLRTLLGFVTVSALLLAACEVLGLDHGLALFGIALFALFGLVAGLIGASQRSIVVVHETSDPSDAALCRNYLRSRGVRAMVLDRAEELGAMTFRNFRVGVPAAEADWARRVLQERPGDAGSGEG